jgi:hypothetical protein
VAKIIPIPAPLRGLNTVNPNISIDDGYARELTNYSLINGKLVSRPSVGNQAYNASGNELSWYDYSGGVYYGIKTDGTIRAITANTGAATIGGAVQTETTELNHLSLQYVIGARQPRLRAYPFTAWTCTPGVITDTAIVCACSHKGRMYVSDGALIDFSGIGQITGNFLTGTTPGGAFPVSQYMAGQGILRMFSANLAGDGQQNVFVIFGDAGKVLVFEGEYPYSGAWRLLANYDMPIPNSRRSFLEVDGDIFVATNEYAYWLKDLIIGGRSAAYENSPSAAIQNLWAALGWANANVERPHVYYLKNVSCIAGLSFADIGLDAIVVQCSEKTTNSTLTGLFDYDNEACCLVYFKKYKAWALWLSTPLFAPVRYINGLYHGVGYGQEVGALYSGYLQDTQGNANNRNIETSWKTPYLYPYAGRNQRSVGIRPFYRSINITAPQVHASYFYRIQAIYDFSDANAPFSFYSQSNVTYIPPGKASGFSKIEPPVNSYNNYSPFVGVGGIGGGVSYQFTQKPIGSVAGELIGTNQIFCATAYIEDGGDLIT